MSMAASTSTEFGHAGVAVVTGAGSGLGAAIAAELAAAGAVLALFDRDSSAAQRTADTIAGAGGRAQVFRCDVAAPAEVEASFAALAAALGAPRSLVNNAGIYPDGAALDIAAEEWDSVLDVNLKGAFLCAQAFARHRLQAGGGGSIVNVASTAAFSARRGAAHYSASKAGMLALTRSLALEWGTHGIRVNAVAPGYIDVRPDQTTPEYRAAFIPMVPLGRTGTPPEVARVVRFLLSDAASFVSGTVLPIDGGFLAGRALIASGAR